MAMERKRRLLAAALSLGAGCCAFATTLLAGAALALWLAGFALTIAAPLLVARARASTPAGRTARARGVPGIVGLGVIVGAVAGPPRR
jgi:MFS family permease